MSSSPQGDAADNRLEDELDENQQGAQAAHPAETDGPPQKRGRGRPKGSKNKKSGAQSLPAGAAGAGSSAEGTIKKKRGRPPKEKKAEDSATDAEPAPKRKRGRPPKNPKPDSGGDGEANGDGAEESTKKKRGRPPKNV